MLSSDATIRLGAVHSPSGQRCINDAPTASVTGRDDTDYSDVDNEEHGVRVIRALAWIDAMQRYIYDQRRTRPHVSVGLTDTAANEHLRIFGHKLTEGCCARDRRLCA